MKAGRVYGSATGVLAAWLVAAEILSSWGRGLALEQRPPTLVEFVLLSFSTWSWRAMPFVVVSAVLSVPLVTAAGALLVRESGPDKGVNWEPLTWLAVGLASWCGAAITVWREWPTVAAVLLVWSGALGVSLSMALAYRVQRRLHTVGKSRVPGWALLGVALLAPLGVPLASILVAVFPVWEQWRRRPTRG